MRRRIFVIGLLILLAGCTTNPANNIALDPTPREVISPDKLSGELASQPIYWQEKYIFLDNSINEKSPSSELMKELRIYSYPQFSHNGRYIAYKYGNLFNKIGLWDSEINEHIELVNSSKDLPYNATVGGIAFTPDDNKVLFSFTWQDDNERVSADIATIDIESGQIEQQNITGLQVTFYDIETSLNGKWAALDMVTLDNQVCLLIDLVNLSIDCLNYEEGWYFSTKFTPDSNFLVYSHTKKIDSTSSIMLSKVDEAKNQKLVSGLAKASLIIYVGVDDIVFVGTAYDDPACAYVYVINLDGSDLRKLSYLGGECSSDE